MALVDNRILQYHREQAPVLLKLVAACDDAGISVELAAGWGAVAVEGIIPSPDTDCIALVLDPTETDRLIDLLKGTQ